MHTVALARNAMATRFELVLQGEDAVALRAAAEEALNEIEQLESKLSLYRPGSEIAQLNARAAREAVRVSPALLALLQHARRLHAESGGAFDVTVGPLVRCWGFMGDGGRQPTPKEIADARGSVGMDLVQLDARNLTVRFARDGVMLDLGAIGKGYAVEQAANLLRSAGVTSGLIHGGTSSVHAIGSPPDAEFWSIAVQTPEGVRGCGRQRAAEAPGCSPAGIRRRIPVAATVPLRDEALSVSAVAARAFTSGGKTFGHVIDPRSGEPVSHTLLAAAVLPSATETDALSTALLVLGKAGLDAIGGRRPGIRALVLTAADGQWRTDARNLAHAPGS